MNQFIKNLYKLDANKYFYIEFLNIKKKFKKI